MHSCYVCGRSRLGLSPDGLLCAECSPRLTYKSEVVAKPTETKPSTESAMQPKCQRCNWPGANYIEAPINYTVDPSSASDHVWLCPKCLEELDKAWQDSFAAAFNAAMGVTP
jgi:hypothetical protein